MSRPRRRNRPGNAQGKGPRGDEHAGKRAGLMPGAAEGASGAPFSKGAAREISQARRTAGVRTQPIRLCAPPTRIDRGVSPWLRPP
jgi:hypothetical protein